VHQRELIPGRLSLDVGLNVFTLMKCIRQYV